MHKPHSTFFLVIIGMIIVIGFSYQIYRIYYNYQTKSQAVAFSASRPSSLIDRAEERIGVSFVKSAKVSFGAIAKETVVLGGALGALHLFQKGINAAPLMGGKIGISPAVELVLKRKLVHGGLSILWIIDAALVSPQEYINKKIALMEAECSEAFLPTIYEGMEAVRQVFIPESLLPRTLKGIDSDDPNPELISDMARLMRIAGRCPDVYNKYVNGDINFQRAFNVVYGPKLINSDEMLQSMKTKATEEVTRGTAKMAGACGIVLSGTTLVDRLKEIATRCPEELATPRFFSRFACDLDNSVLATGDLELASIWLALRGGEKNLFFFSTLKESKDRRTEEIAEYLRNTAAPLEAAKRLGKIESAFANRRWQEDPKNVSKIFQKGFGQTVNTRAKEYYEEIIGPMFEIAAEDMMLFGEDQYFGTLRVPYEVLVSNDLEQLREFTKQSLKSSGELPDILANVCEAMKSQIEAKEKQGASDFDLAKARLAYNTYCKGMSFYQPNQPQTPNFWQLPLQPSPTGF